MFVRISEYTSAAAAPLRARICPRAIALMLLGFGAAGCSANPNGFNDDPYRRQSDATGSVRLDRRSVAQNLRPPMPLLEEPVTRSAGARPTAAVAYERDGASHAGLSHAGLGHVAATTPRASRPGASPGRKPIKLSSQHATSLAEAARPKQPLPEPKLPSAEPKPHGRDTSVVPEAKRVNAQPPSERVVARQAPPQPAAGAPALAPSPSIDASTPIGSLKAAEAGSTFYWPVRGQVIAGFGSKINGTQNKGIDVAVPEDTPVKAADDGVVLYSGNGLKTYGNLLLVRHANGYVTVYAHAKELLVKVGDEIKRGQVIAKSGKTGDVDRPQIHFEIRKASAPVNPLPYLNGA
jgi:murein DD-endopeptidase MepM/ murein hydrolase activator NlpD